MTPIQLRSVLIDTRRRQLKSRLVSSTNYRTGETTTYPVKHSNWRRRLGLGLIGFAVGCVITIAGISVLS